MKRLLGLSLVLGLAPACVLAVNVKGNNLHDDGVDDTDAPWEEPAGDTDPAADSAPEPELHVTATLDPAEMDAGAVELIQLIATADIADATLVGVSFDDTVTVRDTRALDDGSWMLSVEATPDAAGPVDLNLDYGAWGVVTIPGALHVRAPDGPACE